MKHTMRLASLNGDDVLHEWDPDTISPENLESIEREFNDKLEKGYFAANITTPGHDHLIRTFDPNADILLMPKVQGGA